MNYWGTCLRLTTFLADTDVPCPLLKLCIRQVQTLHAVILHAVVTQGHYCLH